MAENTQTALRGVITGNQLTQLYAAAKKAQLAFPAVNVVSTNSINATLEAAKAVNSPVIVQFSNGGGQFYAGKSLPNGNQQASIAGAISGAHHIHQLAEVYDVAVVIHTDHAAKKLLPWIDGLLDAGEKFYTVSFCSLHTCWIYQKSLYTRTLRSAKNTWRECLKSICTSKSNWV
jgi:fructose-bisphosphate aldolase, class II